MAELTSPLTARIGLNRTESLVDRLKEGDEAAFEEVFGLYKDMVYGLAFRLLADKADAMDVSQDVFLTLYRKIRQFRGDCALKTWLYRVTLNQAANRNRWWKRRKKDRTFSLGLGNGSDEAIPIEPGCGRPGQDHQLYSQELQQALQKSLKDLTFDQRAAVILRDVQGLTYEEIAQLLNSELGTIKSRIARGRERLRRLLQPYNEGMPL
ncbi:MAG: sigma-70 family RNA polymerase sigma factor [Acidobacteriota bacterium]